MPKNELNLNDYWRILRRRRWVIFIATMITFLFSAIYTSRQVPVYQAVCRMKLEPTSGSGGAGGVGGMDWAAYYPSEMMTTEAQIVPSRTVIEESLRRLGMVNETVLLKNRESLIESYRSKVSTKRGAGNVLEILVTSENPREAQAFANLVAQVYIEKTGEEKNRSKRYLRESIAEQLRLVKAKLEQAEENLLRYQTTGDIANVRGSFASRLESLKTEEEKLLRQYTNKHPRVIAIQDEVKYLESAVKSLNQSQLVMTRLSREVRVNEELYNMLNRRYKEALIDESGRIESASIIDLATQPKSPIRTRQMTNILVGIIVGLLSGSIFAFILENLDTSIATIEEVEEYLQTQVLGVIPHIIVEGEKTSLFDKISGTEHVSVSDRLIIFHQPKSPIAESYRTLQTNVKFALKQDKSFSILFTSTGLREGKSMTVANYALACAQAGGNERVLLIEADLRRPIVHRIFGIEQHPGLTDILIGRHEWREVVRGTTDILLGDLDREKALQLKGIENLSILPSGLIPHNAVEILNSKQMDNFLQEMKKEFDIVILDCAPTLPVADSIVLAPKVDGVVIVYRVGRTARGALKRTKTQLQSAGANILGIVLNDIRAAELETADYYHYYHRYYYGADKAEVTLQEKIQKWITKTSEFVNRLTNKQKTDKKESYFTRNKTKKNKNV